MCMFCIKSPKQIVAASICKASETNSCHFKVRLSAVHSATELPAFCFGSGWSAGLRLSPSLFIWVLPSIQKQGLVQSVRVAGCCRNSYAMSFGRPNLQEMYCESRMAFWQQWTISRSGQLRCTISMPLSRPDLSLLATKTRCIVKVSCTVPTSSNPCTAFHRDRSGPHVVRARRSWRTRIQIAVLTCFNHPLRKVLAVWTRPESIVCRLLQPWRCLVLRQGQFRDI